MARAFRETLRGGVDRVVLMGTDCPAITDGVVEDAFDKLKHADLVLGPARDGGYYLIGLRKIMPELFLDIPWGTEKVLERTRHVAEDLGLSVCFVKTLDDVDRPEDLAVWENATRHGPKDSSAPRISIIIPTLNEAETIAETLVSTQGPTGIEILVIDGGSGDRTVEIARSHGAEVIASPRGRAVQMNVGAARAKGEFVLFLHGDTRLPKGYNDRIYGTLCEPGTVAGAFKLRMDGSRTGIRFIEWVANCRSQLLGLPYGDQAIFLGAGLFRSLRGFPNMPIMEDFELMKRLGRLGRIRIVPARAVTSDRRWERFGVWQTTLINYAIPLGYSLGVSPSRLARWYHRQ
jgi:rSAM/selenodomain-associated transferase 2